FPLSGHLHHRGTERQIQQAVTTRQLHSVGQAMTRRGRFFKRGRSVVKGVVMRALVRLKVRLPGGGRGPSRPALAEEIIEMRPPKLHEALKNARHRSPLLTAALVCCLSCGTSRAVPDRQPVSVW